MVPQYQLPKRNPDQVVVLNTPAAADADLALGTLTILDESGAVALVAKMSDIIGAKAVAFSAGTANVKTINFASVALVGNTIYRMTIRFPYLVPFYGQTGQETRAVYTTRTYEVSVDATPTVTELRDAFKLRIDNDTQSGVTTSTGSNTLILTSISAYAGAMELVVPTLATVANTTPWVSPSGTPNEVLQYVNSSLVLSGGEYTRYELLLRKYVKHNAIPGLDAVKQYRAFVYADENAAAFAAFQTQIDSVLDGTYTPVADYLGVAVLP